MLKDLHFTLLERHNKRPYSLLSNETLFRKPIVTSSNHLVKLFSVTKTNKHVKQSSYLHERKHTRQKLQRRNKMGSSTGDAGAQTRIICFSRPELY